LPGASFTGVDLNEAALARGRARARALSLPNVALREGDLERLDVEGPFDYVIAHGVYSWIPPGPRDALLAACAERLTPHGVAFVSFNALPGGHLRRALREVLHSEVEAIPDPGARVEAARATLRRLQKRAPYDGEIGRELQRILDAPDGVVYHDTLAATNFDQAISGFAADVATAGLRYLCDAELHEGADAAAEAIAGELDVAAGDRLAREQYLDNLRLRMFRQALLVRADAHAGEQLDARNVAALRVASSLRPARKPRLDERAVDEFRGAKGGTLRIDHPFVKAALLVLGEVWPRSLSFAELAAAAAGRLQAPDGQRDDTTLAQALLEAYRRRAVELHAWESRAVAEPGERPVASALARHQAAVGDTVATLRHQTIRLEDERARRLVTLLDGTRDRDALVEELGLDQRGARKLRERLDQLAALGLLEA